MSTAYVHLLLNHIPVIGTLGCILVLGYGLIRRQQEILRLSLYLFVLVALLTLPVFFSGEGAEDAVRHMPGITRDLIHAHENLARIAMWLTEALGLLALAGLWQSLRKQRLPLPLAGGLVVLSLICAGVLAQTSHLGGIIRHSELRGETAPAQTSPPQPDAAPDTD